MACRAIVAPWDPRLLDSWPHERPAKLRSLPRGEWEEDSVIATNHKVKQHLQNHAHSQKHALHISAISITNETHKQFFHWQGASSLSHDPPSRQCVSPEHARKVPERRLKLPRFSYQLSKFTPQGKEFLWSPAHFG